MAALGNDRWRAAFTVEAVGPLSLHRRSPGSITSCRGGTTSRGASTPRTCASPRGSARSWIAGAAARAAARTGSRLKAWADAARARRGEPDAARARARRRRSARWPPAIPTAATRPTARPSSRWSSTASARASRPGTSSSRARAAPDAGTHGTFDDARRGCPTSPQHGLRRALPAADPSDRPRRAARAATTRWTPAPDDVGSPWAIGAAEGGHKAVHPALGTLEDFRRFVERARALGIEVALDIAFQCAPDHPYVDGAPGVVPQAPRRHDPVRREPAEEVPGHLSVRLRDRGVARAVGGARRACSCSGSAQGVRIFRVDNPHTKPFRSGNG